MLIHIAHQVSFNTHTYSSIYLGFLETPRSLLQNNRTKTHEGAETRVSSENGTPKSTRKREMETHYLRRKMGNKEGFVQPMTSSVSSTISSTISSTTVSPLSSTPTGASLAALGESASSGKPNASFSSAASSFSLRIQASHSLSTRL